MGEWFGLVQCWGNRTLSSPVQWSATPGFTGLAAHQLQHFSAIPCSDFDTFSTRRLDSFQTCQ